MEKDIKILEEKLRQWEPYKNIKFKTEIELELQKENRALENLIKGYRELEEHITFYEKNGSYKKRIIELKEENEELKEQVEYLKHEVVLHGSTVEKLVREKMNSIPKSKIKEKIEEIQGRGLTVYLGGRSGGKTLKQIVNTEIIRVLQELMEDK